MFCSNCGANIPDDSKFCFKCGASTGQVHSISMATKSVDNSTQIEFSIQGMELHFDRRYEKYAQKRKLFLKQVQPYIVEEGTRIQKEVNDIIASAQKDKSSRNKLDNSLIKYYEYGGNSIEMMVQKLHENLISEKVHAFSLEEIKELSEEAIGDFMDALSEFSIKLTPIIAATNELEQARAMQRESRGYWRGGGFGLVGFFEFRKPITTYYKSGGPHDAPDV